MTPIGKTHPTLLHRKTSIKWNYIWVVAETVWIFCNTNYNEFYDDPWRNPTDILQYKARLSDDGDIVMLWLKVGDFVSNMHHQHRCNHTCQPNESGFFITIGWIVMGCPLYMYFVINVQEQGRRYEAIASVTVGTISESEILTMVARTGPKIRIFWKPNESFMQRFTWLFWWYICYHCNCLRWLIIFDYFRTSRVFKIWIFLDGECL